MRTFLFVLLFLLVCVPSVHAQDMATSDAMLATPQTVDYPFPYPGLLPDNPFYRFKVARDNIIGFLITDPLKKAQFDLLQADKRLEAGIMLLAENPSKTNLAITTMSKAENYFFQSIDKTKEAKKQGIETREFVTKLHSASQKYTEILTNITVSAKGADKVAFESLVRRAQDFEKKVATITPHK